MYIRRNLLSRWKAKKVVSNENLYCSDTFLSSFIRLCIEQSILFLFHCQAKSASHFYSELLFWVSNCLHCIFFYMFQYALGQKGEFINCWLLLTQFRLVTKIFQKYCFVFKIKMKPCKTYTLNSPSFLHIETKSH